MNPGFLPLLSWLRKLLWDFTYLCWNLTLFEELGKNNQFHIFGGMGNISLTNAPWLSPRSRQENQENSEGSGLQPLKEEGEMFPKLQKSGADREAMAEKLIHFKEEHEEEVKTDSAIDHHAKAGSQSHKKNRFPNDKKGKFSYLSLFLLLYTLDIFLLI